MEKHLERDEADLGAFFNSLKRGRTNFLVSLYKLIKFMIKYWYVFLLLIIVGVGLGYLKSKTEKKEYESVLVIQINQKSVDHIHEYVDGLAASFSDDEFLKKNNFERHEIKKLEIEAIANFSNLLEGYENRNINLIEHLLENASADDVMTSEFFRSNYQFHKIEIVFGDNYNDTTIDRFIALLNNNDRYDEIYKFYEDFNTKKVAVFENTIEQIDNSIASYIKEGKTETSLPISSSINFRESGFVTSLLEFKVFALRYLEDAKFDELTASQSVYLMNTPYVKQKKPFLKPYVWIPLALVLLFLFCGYLLRTYRKTKNIYESRLSKE